MKHFLLFFFLISVFRLAAQDAASDPSEWQKSYVIIAGESEDYKTLDTLAKKLGDQTRIKYDNQGLVWSAEKQLHLPDDADDEIYAGNYYMRRFDEERISLEMRDWYFDVKPADYSKKMIIVAGIYSDKKKARKQLAMLKKYSPSAYIRTTKIYIGCIH